MWPWRVRAWKRACPHSFLRAIHGDEINAAGGRRLVCRDCGALLDGPVSLAAARAGELELWKHEWRS